MAFRKRIDFQRPSGGVCLAYRNGYCDKGTACNFIHQEDDGRQKQIFVGNLHNEVGEDDLLRLFDKAGKVVGLRWGLDRSTRKFKNFCHIEYLHAESADNALKFNEKTVLGRQVRVSLARGSNSSKKRKKSADSKWSQKDESMDSADGDRSQSNDGKLQKEERKKPCLLCRSTDHVLKDCPKNKDKQNKRFKRFCYNCGDTSHRAAKCRKAKIGNGFTFATCFICNSVGHLSRQCDQNKNGIYPNGGCCRVCGENTHLAKNCPSKNKKLQANNEATSKKRKLLEQNTSTDIDDLDDTKTLLSWPSTSISNVSGDGLDANFVVEDSLPEDKDRKKRRKKKKNKKHS